MTLLSKQAWDKILADRNKAVESVEFEPEDSNYGYGDDYEDEPEFDF